MLWWSLSSSSLEIIYSVPCQQLGTRLHEQQASVIIQVPVKILLCLGSNVYMRPEVGFTHAKTTDSRLRCSWDDSPTESITRRGFGNKLMYSAHHPVRVPSLFRIRELTFPARHQHLGRNSWFIPARQHNPSSYPWANDLFSQGRKKSRSIIFNHN